MGAAGGGRGGREEDEEDVDCEGIGGERGEGVERVEFVIGNSFAVLYLCLGIRTTRVSSTEEVGSR